MDYQDETTLCETLKQKFIEYTQSCNETKTFKEKCQKLSKEVHHYNQLINNYNSVMEELKILSTTIKVN